jgi:hypothetical protein
MKDGRNSIEAVVCAKLAAADGVRQRPAGAENPGKENRDEPCQWGQEDAGEESLPVREAFLFHSCGRHRTEHDPEEAYGCEKQPCCDRSKMNV